MVLDYAIRLFLQTGEDSTPTKPALLSSSSSSSFFSSNNKVHNKHEQVEHTKTKQKEKKENRPKALY